MKKLLSLFVTALISLFVLAFATATPAFAQPTELLGSPYGGPFHLTRTDAGDAQAYTGVLPPNILNGYTQLQVTYNLHGLCVVDGTGGALIFDQGGWKYAQLKNYGHNCLDGNQTVIIPLSDFGVNTTQNLDINGVFHARVWNPVGFTVDITSAVLSGPLPTPTPVPTVTPTPVPTSSPTPNPSFTPDWTIQSIDVMKYTKDVACAPPTQAFIDTEVQRAVDLGANYVAIATQYDNYDCGGGVMSNSLALTTRWVNSIRAHGLHVWHRHMGTAFEGIGVPKSSKDYLEIISNYITSNPTLFAQGDIFTPTPEPDSAGIAGVTYCPTSCAFPNAAVFNQWIRDAQLVSKLSFAQIGLKDKIKIGYYGNSGFIVFGENNSDWYGKSFLEPSTVAAMDNVIVMDTYPENYGSNLGPVLDGAHLVWPNARVVIGEWGTITATTSAQQVSQIDTSMAGSKKTFVDGFNYWQLGPNGLHEPLLNPDLSPNNGFLEVQKFFKGLL